LHPERTAKYKRKSREAQRAKKALRESLRDSIKAAYENDKGLLSYLSQEVGGMHFEGVA